MELENYNILLSTFNDYEKSVLTEYSMLDDDLVLFNPKNIHLNQHVIRIKNNVKNPYCDLYDWAQEEEVETEAMIEAINSLKGLYNKKDSLIKKKESTEKTVQELASGKKNMKTMFSFKSTNEDLSIYINQSAKVS